MNVNVSEILKDFKIDNDKNLYVHDQKCSDHDIKLLMHEKNNLKDLLKKVSQKYCD